MPAFSQRSATNLAECDHHLQVLFNAVAKYRDCTILCGHRGEAEQNQAYSEGKSKLQFPQSKHNREPSIAVDVAPYINGRVSWDANDCRYFAGFVMGIAAAMNMGGRIRWGGDWDSDADTTDNRFNDLVHFELIR